MITRLHLKNFKNFRNATLELGPLTVLVGTNASGKSNLRDAFRFIHGMSRGYNLAEIFGERYTEGVLQWKGIRGGTREVAYRGGNSFQIETTVLVPAEGAERGSPNRDRISHLVAVGISPDNGPAHITDERLLSHMRPEQVYKFRQSSASSEPHSPQGFLVRVPGDAGDGIYGKQLRFPDSQPVLSQLERHDDVPEFDKKALAAYRHHLESMRFLDPSPEAMRRTSFPGQVVLGDRGENLSSVIHAICEDREKRHALAEWINELTPQDVVDFDFVPDQTGKILLTLVESNGRRTSAYSASDGTLRFLALIAAILGPDAAGFYFLEELDNGIHPTRLYLLLQLIEQHAKQGKVQVVATTHSPQMLAMLSEEAREHASLVYRLGTEPEGRICRIMDIPKARKVLEEHNLARLHESGWLENAVAFADSEEASA